MTPIALKPVRSDVQYQGRFATLAFQPLASPAAVYQNLLQGFSKYGATLQSLKIDVSSLSEANITCSLSELSTVIQLRLDRLDILFFKFHEIAVETASQILLDSWQALREADPSLDIAEHRVFINVYTEILGEIYDRLMQRYVIIPSGFGQSSHGGVVYYLPTDLDKGELRGSIILDRVGDQDGGLILKFDMSLDARSVPFNALSQRVEEYVTRILGHLGLTFEREGEP